MPLRPRINRFEPQEFPFDLAEMEFMQVDVEPMIKVVKDILEKRRLLDQVYHGRKFEVICGPELFEKLFEWHATDLVGFDIMVPIEMRGPYGLRIRDMPVRIVPGFKGAEVIPTGEPEIRVPPRRKPPLTLHAVPNYPHVYQFSDGVCFDERELLASPASLRQRFSDEHLRLIESAGLVIPRCWEAPAKQNQPEPPAAKSRQIIVRRPRRSCRNRISRYIRKWIVWRQHRRFHRPRPPIELPCVYCVLEARKGKR